MNTTLLIFDIDGTLMTTHAGRRAFNQTFEQFFGLQDACATVPMAGRTDPLIYKEVCDMFRLDPQTYEDWKAAYLPILAEHLEADPGYVHRGVSEFLGLCAHESGIHLALGTGNIVEGARMKLAMHDLNRFFPTGGFGDDGATRDEVIAQAVSRSEALAGRPFDTVFVIGDTPHDIACGKANRCRTVGVTTGRHTAQELQESGADIVLPDLSDASAILSALRCK